MIYTSMSFPDPPEAVKLPVTVTFIAPAVTLNGE